MADSNGNAPDLVAKLYFFTGSHSGMGLAAKGMVVVFVVFTALNVGFANGIYSAFRGWIEKTLSRYQILLRDACCPPFTVSPVLLSQLT